MKLTVKTHRRYGGGWMSIWKAATRCIERMHTLRHRITWSGTIPLEFRREIRYLAIMASAVELLELGRSEDLILPTKLEYDI